ncbi:nuclear transport factor 2 family protein [Burkholderia sp. Ac-20353]|nr:nuclear transport factor 2 family protein [Burkholderia sp. Ac-20353]
MLSHYDDAFEMHSPMIARIAEEPSGCLRGKDAVGAYWSKALQLIPDLRFELVSVLVGVRSIAIHYLGANGRPAVEVFHFGADQRVLKAFAHYAA